MAPVLFVLALLAPLSSGQFLSHDRAHSWFSSSQSWSFSMDRNGHPHKEMHQVQTETLENGNVVKKEVLCTDGNCREVIVKSDAFGGQSHSMHGLMGRVHQLRLSDILDAIRPALRPYPPAQAPLVLAPVTQPFWIEVHGNLRGANGPVIAAGNPMAERPKPRSFASMVPVLDGVLGLGALSLAFYFILTRLQQNSARELPLQELAQPLADSLPMVVLPPVQGIVIWPRKAVADYLLAVYSRAVQNQDQQETARPVSLYLRTLYAAAAKA